VEDSRSNAKPAPGKPQQDDLANETGSTIQIATALSYMNSAACSAFDQGHDTRFEKCGRALENAERCTRFTRSWAAIPAASLRRPELSYTDCKIGYACDSEFQLVEVTRAHMLREIEDQGAIGDRRLDVAGAPRVCRSRKQHVGVRSVRLILVERAFGQALTQ